jgi:hypothetical protein
MKIRNCPLPRQRTRVKSFVVRLLHVEAPAVEESDRETDRHFPRKPLGEGSVRANDHATQHPLDVIFPNPLGGVLLRHELAIQECHGDHVREPVVGLLFRSDLRLLALCAAANDVEGDVEGVDLDALDLGAGEPVPPPQL